MLTNFGYNPDRQAPMPFKAADDYARTVMGWANELSNHQIKVQMDVAYGPNRLHRYNIFSPPDAKNAPVVVCWHGGGWTNGYRGYNSFMAPHITALGCVLVSPSYRLVAEAKLPAAFEDSLQMLAHVAQNVAQFGGDPHQLYLAGHSAGAHLASLAALRVADCTKAGVLPCAVRGCLPISGIMDLYHPSPAPGSLEERIYSMVLQNPLLDAVMSPICWTAGNRVPFALSFGEHDSERVQKSNLRVAELLKLQNAPVTLAIRQGQDHFSSHTSLRDTAHPWYQTLKHMIESNRS